MASTAISAQGTKFYIKGTSSAPVTATAAVAGFPTIITATAHGFQNGDSVVIAGNAYAGLNGTFTVMNKTTNTFAVNVNSLTQTVTFTAGTATGAAWIQVKNMTNIKGIDGSAKEIDVTNHDSLAYELLLGLPDNGNLMADFDGDNSDAGQLAVEAAREDTAIRTFKYTLPAGSTPNATFSGFVKKFDVSMTTNDKFKRTLDVRITGPVTFS